MELAGAERGESFESGDGGVGEAGLADDEVGDLHVLERDETRVGEAGALEGQRFQIFQVGESGHPFVGDAAASGPKVGQISKAAEVLTHGRDAFRSR